MKLQDVEDALAQLIDAGGGNPDRAPDLPTDTLRELASQLPDDDWADEHWALLDQAWTTHVDAWIATADKVRHSCQMTGRAIVGDILIRPNPEFVCQTGPAEVRALQLRDWPASPHFWISLQAPDGHTVTYNNGEVKAWTHVLAETHDEQTEWEARVEKDREARLERRHRAQAARRRAAQALIDAETELTAAKAALSAPDDRPISAAEFATLRHLIGLTIDQMAERLEVNPRSVRSWESGRDAISPRNAGRIRALVAEHDRTTTAIAAAGGRVTITRGDGWTVAALARAWRTNPSLEASWEQPSDQA